MRVPPEKFDGPAFGALRETPNLSFDALEEEEEEEDTPLELWSGSMHRLTAPGGYLVVVTCCFSTEEVTGALGCSDSLFAQGVSFKLIAQHEPPREPGTTGVSFCLYRKEPCRAEPPSAMLWEWQRGEDEFTPYDTATSDMLEEVYQRGVIAIEVPISLPETDSRPAGYTVDLARMRQRGTANHGERAVRRRRRDGAAVDGIQEVPDVPHLLTSQIAKGSLGGASAAGA